jgi:hypothetical protein
MLYKCTFRLIFFLVLINSQIFIEAGSGDCVQSDELTVGCVDSNPQSLIKEVRFEFNNYPEYFSSNDAVTYIVELGAEVEDGTVGDLLIKTPKREVPGNKLPPGVVVMHLVNESKDHRILFEPDFSNKSFLGKADNEFMLRYGDKKPKINFEGPNVIANFDFDIIPDDKGEYIKNITLNFHSTIEMTVELVVKDENGKFHEVENTWFYFNPSKGNEYDKNNWNDPKDKFGEKIKYNKEKNSYSLNMYILS